MIHEVFPVGVLRCNCSLLGDEISREAIVVDPGADVAAILSRVAAHQLIVKQILVTHAHIDHIAGALTLQQSTGAPVLYNQADLPLVAMMDLQAGWIGVATPKVKRPDASPAHGDTFGVTGLGGIVLHTPDPFTRICSRSLQRRWSFPVMDRQPRSEWRRKKIPFFKGSEWHSNHRICSNRVCNRFTACCVVSCGTIRLSTTLPGSGNP